MDNTYPIASRKRRIAALLVDSWWFGLLTTLIVFWAIEVSALSLDDLYLSSSYSLFTVAPLLSFFIFMCKDAYQGMSPGKRLLGIRVLNKNLEPVTPWQTLVRNLTLPFWPLDFLAMILSSKKRRLGDYLANTQVVRDTQINSEQRLIVAGLMVAFYMFTPNLPALSVSPDAMLQWPQMMIKRSGAYEYAEQQVRVHSGIEQFIGVIQDIEVGGNSQINMVNQHGHAQFELNVIGEKDSLPVFVTLDRENGQWQLVSLNYEHIDK
ncbi:MAG: RDD family protein [Gammaproteobacteria bacterium]|nr:RDD family protein [Gammaproteobacteria bacterium]